jgi:hypothetical protein
MSMIVVEEKGIKSDRTSPPLSGRLLLGAFDNDGRTALDALAQAARREHVVAAENRRLAVAADRPRARRRARRLTPAAVRGLLQLLDELGRRGKGGRP